MENATEALYIAVGTLIGVMIISLVVFFFRRVGSLQEQQDRVMTAEQLAEWNNMYLAYNKKIMYGTDLISVLNKAQSNNDKYVNGKGFLTGYKYTNSYLINIEFTLNSPLQDSITVYYFDEDKTKKEVAYTTGDKPDDGTKLFDIFSLYNIEGYKNKTINDNYDTQTNLEVRTDNSKFDSGTYSLYNIVNNNPEANTQVEYLMKLSNNMKMDVTNRGVNISRWTEELPNGTSIVHKGWSHATWVTCLSDLKSRKFSCTGVEYDTSNDQTGRVIKMTFTELDHK
jgi:hypothetical protein